MLDDSSNIGSDDEAIGAEKRKVKVKVKYEVAPPVGIVTTTFVTGTVLPRGRILLSIGGLLLSIQLAFRIEKVILRYHEIEIKTRTNLSYPSFSMHKYANGGAVVQLLKF